jgi:hypothetical protein
MCLNPLIYSDICETSICSCYEKICDKTLKSLRAEQQMQYCTVLTYINVLTTILVAIVLKYLKEYFANNSRRDRLFQKQRIILYTLTDKTHTQTLINNLLLYCGVFTPCNNCNIEIRSHNYASVDEAVFSPCRAEPSRAEP